MPELLVDFITSLDGCAGADGWPGWWGLEGPGRLPGDHGKQWPRAHLRWAAGHRDGQRLTAMSGTPTSAADRTPSACRIPDGARGRTRSPARRRPDCAHEVCPIMGFDATILDTEGPV